MTATEKRLRKAMRDLGTYKPQFNHVIEICGRMMDQYDKLTADVEDGNVAMTEITEAGGTKKSATALIIEGLRKDILAYHKELGLTPGALKKMNDAALKVNTGGSFAEAIAQAMTGAGG